MSTTTTQGRIGAMNARGQAVAQHMTPVSGPEALRRTLAIAEQLSPLDEDQALAYVEGLSDEALADAVNVTVFASRGVNLFAKLFAIAAMERFEYGAEDFYAAKTQQHDLAAVQGALAEEEAVPTTTTQGEN